jgi:hypothetical protein
MYDVFMSGSRVWKHIFLSIAGWLECVGVVKGSRLFGLCTLDISSYG